MAFWNAPIETEGHADEAIETALEMLKELDKFNQEVAEEGVPAFGMGVGINTGFVIVGNMGSSQRFDYTCLGDSVNLASRLEGQSKSYGVQLVVGESTVKASQRGYNFVELDRIAVKGKTKPETIYTVADVSDTTAHKKFLRAYYAGEWKTAFLMTEHLKKSNTELSDYYNLMGERLKLGCPVDWKGHYVATSK